MNKLSLKELKIKSFVVKVNAGDTKGGLAAANDNTQWRDCTYIGPTCQDHFQAPR